MKVKKFILEWPTENHDYRRTGYTLLKGDLLEQDLKFQLNFFLDATTGTTEQVVKPSIADIDGNGLMDQVILVHKTSFNTYTNMYGLETGKFSKNKPSRKWTSPVKLEGGAVYFPATLANIDSDSRKEIITGTRNGTVYAFDVSSSGSVSQKWVYYLEERDSPLAGRDLVRFNGGNAVFDMDNIGGVFYGF